jgi:hypothetical protein
MPHTITVSSTDDLNALRAAIIALRGDTTDDNKIKRIVGKQSRTLFGFRMYDQVGDELLTVRVAGANHQ